ncbi:MAG: MFS transporter [Ruminococcaceae bacterium]|nr:MFS transporter [Oscillospiraceae bacterium]
MKKNTKFNFIIMWFNSSCSTASASLASVAVLSAFFLRGGMTDQQVSFYLTFTQLVNLVISLLLSGITSGLRDSRKTISTLYVARGITTGLFAIFCFWQIKAAPFYVMMILIGGLQALVTAVQGIFDYKLPCEVIEMEHYSTLIAYQGLFNGLVGMGIAMVLPTLFQRFDFMHTTGFICIAAALCYVFAAVCVRFLRPVVPIDKNETASAEKLHMQFNPIRDFIRLMQNRDFRYMLLPNLVRGFGAGMVSMLAIIAMRGLHMSDADVSWITSCTYLGTLLSCFAYTFLVKRMGVPWTGLIGSLVFGLMCFSMMGGTLWFLVVYTIAYIGYNVVCNAVPDMVYQSVSQDIISSFHTWRLALTTLGTAISTSLFGILLDKTEAYVLVVIGCVGIVLCSLGHYLFYRKSLAPKRN